MQHTGRIKSLQAMIEKEGLGLQNIKSNGKIVIGVSFPGDTKKTMSVDMVSLLTF